MLARPRWIFRAHNGVRHGGRHGIKIEIKIN
jgi:hypothetical protein